MIFFFKHTGGDFCPFFWGVVFDRLGAVGAMDFFPFNGVFEKNSVPTGEETRCEDVKRENHQFEETRSICKWSI